MVAVSLHHPHPPSSSSYILRGRGSGTWSGTDVTIFSLKYRLQLVHKTGRSYQGLRRKNTR
eukprot:scaffold7657_cov115-Skeletonema_dohrnii-CCMP3373.AAC.1